MNKSVVETIVGLIVLLLAVGSVIIAYKEGGFVTLDKDSYIIKAEFDKIDGVNVGSPVKVSGITIGKVIEQSIDKRSYHALVQMKIKQDIKLPIDTSAEIIGLGLMSDKYISLVPGSDDKYLNNGGVIEFTQSSLSLESLIGKFIFGGAEKKAGPKGSSVELKDSLNTERENGHSSISDEIDSINVSG
ncbi:MAG: outer membrane lipid asymmetry maintenance protein MlaD [Candidatus Midichloria sp.]|nr:MAG: outer membrane lipid asymmetry maintenance protein MlaD [Candidatus Midichloria sp.]